MFNLNLPAFYLGVREELEKHSRCWEDYEPVPGKEPYSEDSCRPKGENKKEKKEKKSEEIAVPTKVAVDLNTMPINENILPTISSQAKWKFVRTKDGLKLTDGNLVYSFGGLPEEFPAEDTRLSRLSDDNILDFDKNAISKGTAQIHRSSPDNIYMTLATGADNPTFMLQHEEGQNWRYSPSKKFISKLKAIQEKAQQENPTSPENISVDPQSLVSGAEEQMKQALYNPYLGVGHGLTSQEIADHVTGGIDKAKEYGDTAVSFMAEHPLASLGIGYTLAKSFRNLTNSGHLSPEEKEKQEIQAIAAGALPTLASLAIKAT